MPIHKLLQHSHILSTDIDNMPCWYFERKEIKNSPSFRDGIDTATENRYRREGARFIIDAGTKMGLLYDTCATGVVYFHRFYMFHSFKEFYRYVTAACCLFLAGKVEETPKKCKDIIKIAQSLISPASFLRFGEDPREEVMTMERILLKTIKFDLQVEHPYGCMLKFAKNFKGDKEKTQKMAQMAWTFINDSLCTTLCLQWEPEIVAVSLMYLASRLTKFEPSDWTGREGSKSKWWEDFIEGMSMELMEDICHQVLDLYSSKQKKTTEGDSPPQSPIKGNRQQSSPPPPPPPTSDRTFSKRTREDVTSEVDPPAKIGKLDKDVKTSSTSQSSVSNASGAPIPVAQHITPSSGNHPSYSVGEHGGGIDFSSYNPYVSSQMYSSSFMSQEGSQNIQSILAGNAPPPTTNVYSDHHVHHSQSTDSSQYPPPIPQTDMTYSYPPPQQQYSAPPLSHQHPYPSISNISSTAPSYDPYNAPPNSTQYATPSYPPPPIAQQPPQHSYPPSSIPPPQAYSSFYSPANHSSANQLGPPPRMSNYPSQPPYPSHPQSVSSAQNYGQSHNQGGYQKLGKQNASSKRKDSAALTKVKISGRSDWNPQN